MKRTTAAGSVGGLYDDYVAGISPGTLLVAEDRNNLQEEICHLIEAVGWSLDSTDQYQLLRSTIALRESVGAIVEFPYKATPITVAASKSTTNPSFPLYLPIIDVTDADHDVPSTQAPDLVTTLRAYAAEVLGSSSFTATWAASVGTFANTAVNNALLLMIQEDALVQRWFSSSQSATYAGSGGNYTGGRSVNVAGTDFPITAVSIGSRTITVTGTPTAGSQTVIFYPFRITGSTTSVRLHRLSGFVPVAAGDVDGVEIAGMRHMDAGQGHWHSVGYGSTTGGSRVQPTPLDVLGRTPTDAGSVSSTVYLDAITIKTDGTNGTPRVAKVSSPRAHARHTYYWAGRLLT